ncbi:MAG: EVE domain-containing protein [Omnitrophica bacterium GWA2_52_12]|nr:MAG: EVE domain-containing protein [Omnitrophica bacterium GWA2_52_12]
MAACWLMKSEPEVYSIDDLARDKKTGWDGVRNYQARNFLRDQIKEGDRVLFYHSNAEPPGIAGIAEVVRGGYPDPSAFLEGDVPVWYSVDVRFVKKFKDILPLEKLRSVKGLETMLLLKRGQRLSVQPVTEKEWAVILKLAEK